MNASSTASDSKGAKEAKKAARAKSSNGSKKRSRADGTEPVFRAPDVLSESLQRVLVDLVELANQGKQAHWNIVGPNFRDLHRQLDEVVTAARGFADDVAERMRALRAVPDGRSRTVSETTTLPAFPEGEVLTTDAVVLVGERLRALIATCRDVHDDVDEADPTSADMLHAILERMEQLDWMVVAERLEPRPVGGAHPA